MATAKNTEATAKINNSTVVKGMIHFGEIQEDSAEVTFIRGTLLSSNPCDEEGNPVMNPGSIMIYSCKGLKTGDCNLALLIKRGLGGLYDYVQPENQEKVLSAMGLTMEEIPEIPVVESISSTMDRGEARKRASDIRRKRNELKQARIERELNNLTSEVVTPAVVEEELV